MVSHLLHALTDRTSALGGKFVVTEVWVFLVLLLALFAPNLNNLYINTQNLPVTNGPDQQREIHSFLGPPFVG